jgi:hypothetical protein
MAAAELPRLCIKYVQRASCSRPDHQQATSINRRLISPFSLIT